MFKINIKLLIFVFMELLFLQNFPTVRSTCEVYISEDSKVIPRFEKLIGETALEVNITNKRFVFGGKVIGFCETYFRIPEPRMIYQLFSGLTFSRVHTLTCENSILRLFGKEVYNIPIFECLPYNSNIVYRSDKQFSWCNNHSNSTTFFLLTKVNKCSIIISSICFDLEKASLRTIKYKVLTSQKSNQEIHKRMEIVEWPFYEILENELSLLKANKSLVKTDNFFDSLFPLTNYEESPIVQGHSYVKYFEEYTNLFSIIWWRNLRLGNWKLFINTLENYAHNHSFEMYSGSSDILKLPVNLGKIYELNNGSKTLTIPAYIWSYVKSEDGNNKDFVIIGYNSPYFFSMNEVIFCPDICSEIPWLKDVYTSFRNAFMGVMFCCSTDFIKDTNRLEEFPTEVLQDTYKDLH